MKVGEHPCYLSKRGGSCVNTVPNGDASAFCDEHKPAGDGLTLKGRQCFCRRCSETFTSPITFDLHQRLSTKTGQVECLDPRTMKNRHNSRVMVLTKRGWGKNPERSTPQNNWWEKRRANG